MRAGTSDGAVGGSGPSEVCWEVRAGLARVWVLCAATGAAGWLRSVAVAEAWLVAEASVAGAWLMAEASVKASVAEA